MHIADFDFPLPPELIAQEPPVERGRSRLLVLDRTSGAIADRQFYELPELMQRGDLLVVNNTRVFPARLLGRRLPGGGAAECLLLRPLESEGVWEALVHPGQRLKDGSRLEFRGGEHLIHGEVLDRRFHGRRHVRLWVERGNLTDAIDAIGHVPLPPYIKRPDVVTDRERYQTIYAQQRGSIAAPTAGLHFTPRLLAALDAHGVERAEITLHVGYGTFQPVRVEHIEDHRVEEEHYEVSPAAAAAINRARTNGRRVIAVGTTTTRTLESLPVGPGGHVEATTASTDLCVCPGHQFRIVSGLVTNFHLPQSSLLLLVSALGGREKVLAAYRHAIEERYRFYSYGDAMLIL
ncbi:MAG: tRNA preQ1(34) S-adenosylmethionine ribosyltransferase-isomerase QueA [Acidobacteria bacterium]|nr:tRNA preQ1(34) S-adenosylmethionine ribosyltransferase-isomerase QueA [Acidobacteriota bacterium]